jgi:hypothetical protein
MASGVAGKRRWFWDEDTASYPTKKGPKRLVLAPFQVQTVQHCLILV